MHDASGCDIAEGVIVHILSSLLDRVERVHQQEQERGVLFVARLLRLGHRPERVALVARLAPLAARHAGHVAHHRVDKVHDGVGAAAGALQRLQLVLDAPSHEGVLTAHVRHLNLIVAQELDVTGGVQKLSVTRTVAKVAVDARCHRQQIGQLLRLLLAKLFDRILDTEHHNLGQVLHLGGVARADEVVKKVDQLRRLAAFCKQR